MYTINANETQIGSILFYIIITMESTCVKNILKLGGILIF